MALRFLLLSAIAGIFLVVWTHNNLPEVVAIHFGQKGAADNMMSNQGSLQLSLIAILSTTAIVFFIPILIKKIPIKWVNLPNKDYWFNDEKIEETSNKIKKLFYWLGTLYNLFFSVVFILVYQAHGKTPPTLDNKAMYISLLVFSISMCVWLFVFFHAFKKNKP